jgi:hypothetical protein
MILCYAHLAPSQKVKAVDMLDDTINGDLNTKQYGRLRGGDSL